MSGSWRLKCGKELLDTLTQKSFDQPWIVCRFQAEPAFRQYAELFKDELGVLNRDEMHLWEQAYQRIIDLGLTLHPVDTVDAIAEFILHIDGEEAWFRY
jgi:hypothetical protein